MSVKSLTQRDLREAPAYSIAEAAGYLRIPKSTLRAWLLGQQSCVTRSQFAGSIICVIVPVDQHSPGLLTRHKS